MRILDDQAPADCGEIVANDYKNNGIAPTNFFEACKLAEFLSKSDMIPKNYVGKVGSILAAIQMGSEIGLKPMQALQNIAVINGRPTLWGDAMLALVQSHSSFEYIRESDDGQKATCTVKRKNADEHTVTFSNDDARKAGLLGKPGPWSQYPARMRQVRARGFAIRDQFADALKGFSCAEEVLDYNVIEHEPAKKIEKIKQKEKVVEAIDDHFKNNVEINEKTDCLSEEQCVLIHDLIKKHNISDETVKNALEKCGVEYLIDMPSDKGQQWIDYLIAKYGHVNDIDNIDEQIL
jgi:hypothetical protein